MLLDNKTLHSAISLIIFIFFYFVYLLILVQSLKKRKQETFVSFTLCLKNKKGLYLNNFSFVKPQTHFKNPFKLTQKKAHETFLFFRGSFTSCFEENTALPLFLLTNNKILTFKHSKENREKSIHHENRVCPKNQKFHTKANLCNSCPFFLDFYSVEKLVLGKLTDQRNGLMFTRKFSNPNDFKLKGCYNFLKKQKVSERRNANSQKKTSLSLGLLICEANNFVTKNEIKENTDRQEKQNDTDCKENESKTSFLEKENKLMETIQQFEIREKRNKNKEEIKDSMSFSTNLKDLTYLSSPCQNDDNIIDEYFMRKAILMAVKGLGYTRPNPTVGCIIVYEKHKNKNKEILKNFEVIGEGFHKKAGDMHAEVMALKSVYDRFCQPTNECFKNLKPLISKKIEREEFDTYFNNTVNYSNEVLSLTSHNASAQKIVEIIEKMTKSVLLKEILKNCRMYITLEPCAHYGRTPPCAEVLLSVNIPYVIIGCIDNNVNVGTKGIKKLLKSNVKVKFGVLSAECLKLNYAFIYTKMPTNVHLNFFDYFRKLQVEQNKVFLFNSSNEKKEISNETKFNKHNGNTFVSFLKNSTKPAANDISHGNDKHFCSYNIDCDDLKQQSNNFTITNVNPEMCNNNTNQSKQAFMSTFNTLICTNIYIDYHLTDDYNSLNAIKCLSKTQMEAVKEFLVENFLSDANASNKFCDENNFCYGNSYNYSSCSFYSKIKNNNCDDSNGNCYDYYGNGNKNDEGKGKKNTEEKIKEAENESCSNKICEKYLNNEFTLLCKQTDALVFDSSALSYQEESFFSLLKFVVNFKQNIIIVVSVLNENCLEICKKFLDKHSSFFSQKHKVLFKPNFSLQTPFSNSHIIFLLHPKLSDSELSKFTTTHYFPSSVLPLNTDSAFYAAIDVKIHKLLDRTLLDYKKKEIKNENAEISKQHEIKGSYEASHKTMSDDGSASSTILSPSNKMKSELDCELFFIFLNNYLKQELEISSVAYILTDRCIMRSLIQNKLIQKIVLINFPSLYYNDEQRINNTSLPKKIIENKKCIGFINNFFSCKLLNHRETTLNFNKKKFRVNIFDV